MPVCVGLKGQCHEIFCFWFFSDISSSRLTTGINDTGGKFATGVNNTSGKIATGMNDTGGKFATGINDTGGKFCHQFHLCC